ncbi:ClpP/crotonase-like domain-containing protein [Mycena haematopus]|nr:ClpP/crotonase-like domain-containing protein [Mycena haematopus]
MAYPLSFPTQNPLVTVTHPKDTIWVIELHNGQDNRLIPNLVDHALKPALDAVELHWRKQWREAQNSKEKTGGNGAVIIVGRKDQDKFFSNVTFNPLLERIIKFPIPTICAINGHCFAGGFMLSLANRNAWLCMNEVDFGAVWPHSFAGILNAKIGDARVRRRIALEGHRFTPQEALSAGIVDHIVSGNTAAELAVAVGAKAQGQCSISNDIFWDALEALKRDPRMSSPLIEDTAAKAKL